jgi:ATP-binding protein involved in chromosome partitioning
VSDGPVPVPVIAVASGKGGVGKTTVAVNVSLALQAQGAKVGLVDADIYGPDVPRMMGLRRREDATHVTLFARKGAGRTRLEVIERHGIQLASAAFLMGENQGLSVEAGIAALIVKRLIFDAAWKDRDYLVVDLPPGTADVQQFVFALHSRPLLVLMVVTPQVIAHQDGRRLIAALRGRANAGIGGIENMSGQVCPACGQTTELFPPAPPEESIWAMVPKLASVPFSFQAAQDADQGRPVLVTGAVPEQVAAYELIAKSVKDMVGSDAL